MTADGPLPRPDASLSATATPPEPRWGLGDAFGGWLLAVLMAGLWTSIVVGLADVPMASDLSLGWTAVANAALWVGFIGVAYSVSRVKGNGWVADYKIRLAARDLPFGAIAGTLAQLLVVPLVSVPVLWLAGKTSDDLTEPAREMADKVSGAGGPILFFLIVGIGAPIAEELFFRGLVMGALEKRFGPWWALAGSSVFFGATHFQPLQFVGLTVAGAVFGYMVIRTGRLGPAVVAHMAFNSTAVVALLWLT